jgi:hypothetical protein
MRTEAYCRRLFTAAAAVVDLVFTVLFVDVLMKNPA